MIPNDKRRLNKLWENRNNLDGIQTQITQIIQDVITVGQGVESNFGTVPTVLIAADDARLSTRKAAHFKADTLDVLITDAYTTLPDTGGRIVLSEGTHVLSSAGAVIPSSKSVHLLGMGVHATEIDGSAVTSGTAFTFEGASGTFHTASDFRLELGVAGGDGILLDDAAMWIRFLDVIGFTNYGIDIANTSDGFNSFVVGCRLDHGDASWAGSGIRNSAGSGVDTGHQVMLCHISRSNKAVEQTASGADLQVIANQFFECNTGFDSGPNVGVAYNNHVDTVTTPLTGAGLVEAHNDQAGHFLTTKGDLHTFDTDHTRLPVGTDGHVLTADSAQATGIKWAAGGGGSSPLTTKGDVHGYDTGDARIPVGTNGQFFKADSTDAQGVVWASIVEADVTDLDHDDVDAIHDNVAGEINALTAVTPATGDMVLIEDASDSFNKKKANFDDFGGGASSPLTTKGDIWGYSTVDARVPVGADGLILVADSSQTLGVKWASGGGGGAATGALWNAMPQLPTAPFIAWDGDLAGMSSVDITGTQTVTEGAGVLSVTFQDQAANDINCRLKAHSFSTGDSFSVPMRILQRVLESFCFAVLVFTDGTTSSSNAVAAAVYTQPTGGGLVWQIWDGTLTSMTGASSAIGVDLRFSSTFFATLTYTAANTFDAAWGLDGVTALSTAQRTPTITPTHVGVGWSAWNAASTDNIRQATFGPVVKVA